jgi:hypothetical protein
MSLGSFIIQICSTCGNYTLHRNVFSDPTARSKLWTDGKRNGANLARHGVAVAGQMLPLF